MKLTYFAALFASAFALARAAKPPPSNTKPISNSGSGQTAPDSTHFLEQAKRFAAQGKQNAEQYLSKIKHDINEVDWEKIQQEIKKVYDEQAEKMKNPSAVADKAKDQLNNLVEQLNKFRKNGADAATGLTLILAGLFLVFRGRTAFKAFLALSGFIMGGCVGLYLGHFSTYITSFKVHDWYIWVFTVALAVGGSIFVTRVYRWSVAMISIFSGMYTAIFLMGLLQFPSEQYQKYLVLAGFSGVFLALSSKFEEAIVITSTAIMGSFAATFGADSIYHFGFRQLLQSMVDVKKDEIFLEALKHSATDVLRAVLVSAVLLAACGVYIQYRFLPRGYDQD